MATIYETGHAKNIANFNALYQILQEMGTLYNPTNPSLQLQNLDPIKAQLSSAIQTLDQKKPLYKNAVATREESIATLSKLVTKTLNYAKSTPISQTDKQNLAAQVKKIRGDTPKRTTTPENQQTESISTSQMSYDNRIANFGTFISQLSSFTEYAPNETDIQLTALQTYQDNLQTLSQSVNTAGNALITARKNRNDLLYNNAENVIRLVKEIKSYIKSLAESAYPYYQAITRLKFTAPK